MGFSIRSELASYARLKRRCYFLFVISYGGLLAGLTYAAMTHQSPPLWIGLIPGAALSVPLPDALYERIVTAQENLKAVN